MHDVSPVTHWRRLCELVTSQAGVAFTNHCAGYALQLAMFAFLAIRMDAYDYGAFVLTQTWLLLLSRFSVAGLEAVITRYTSVYAATANKNADFALTTWSQRQGFATSILLSILVIGAGLFCRQADMISYLFVAGTIPAATIVAFLSAELRGRGLPNHASFAVNTLRPLITTIPLLLFFNTQNRVALQAVLATSAAAIATSLVLLSAIAQATRPTSTKPDSHRRKRLVNLWKHSGRSLLLNDISLFALRQSDIVILALFVNTAEIAAYSIAMRIAGLCVFITPVVDGLVSHKYASFYSKRDLPSLQRLVIRSNRTKFYATLLSGLAATVASFFVLPHFSTHPIASITTTVLSVTCWTVASAIGQVGFLLSMCRLEQQQLIVTLFCGTTTIISAFILSPLLGITGAAASFGIPLIASAVLYRRMAKIHLRIELCPFGRISQPEPRSHNTRQNFPARPHAA